MLASLWHLKFLASSPTSVEIAENLHHCLHSHSPSNTSFPSVPWVLVWIRWTGRTVKLSLCYLACSISIYRPTSPLSCMSPHCSFWVILINYYSSLVLCGSWFCPSFTCVISRTVKRPPDLFSFWSKSQWSPWLATGRHQVPP